MALEISSSSAYETGQGEIVGVGKRNQLNLTENQGYGKALKYDPVLKS